MLTAQTPRRPLAPWTLLVALSLAACSGKSVDQQSSEPGTGGTGAGSDGNDTGGASSTGGGSIGGSSAGGTAAGGGSIGGGTSSGGSAPSDSCAPQHDEAPGTPIYAPTQVGTGECEGVTLGSIIDSIHDAFPELADIQTLYAPDPDRLGDGSFIYAFQKPDGTFALVFKRGGGDCPSGCTENDYWYFDTAAECAISAEGQTSRPFDGCLPSDQLPKWGIPAAAPPESICGSNMAPQDLSGDYEIHICGQAYACTTAKDSQPRTLSTITLHIVQDPADLAQGTVTLSGTGEPLIDGRALSATFERRRFHVEEHESNLPAQCVEAHDLTLDYDFEGFGPQHLSFFQASTIDCEGNPGDYCKGEIEAALGGRVSEE